jgi:high-affinity Fe2+/Pb2+ permease
MARDRRQMIRRETRLERRFIWTMAIIIAVIVGLAIYGYWTGAWEQAN